MSTLTSSAVGGRKAPPKAPPRRRAVPRGADKNAATEESSSTENQAATPGATQESPSSSALSRDVPPPPAVIERPVVVSNAAPDIGLATPAATQGAANDALTDRSATSDGTTVISLQNGAAATSKPAVNTGRGRKRANEAAFTSEQGPPKRVKATRSARAGAASSLVEQDPSTLMPPPPTPAATQTAESTATQNTTAVRTSGRRRTATQRYQDEPTITQPRRRRAAQSDANAAIDPAITGEIALTASQVADSLAAQLEQEPVNPKPRRKPRKKAATAADGEDDGVDDVNEKHEIDPSTLSMFDLSHDSKHGKTSEREKKMAKIDWAEVARKRREEADAIANGEAQPDVEGQGVLPSIEGNDDAQTNGEDGTEQPVRPEPITRASGGGVRFRVVAGQLVEDEASLTIDRAARVAQAAAETADQPIEEENDLTVRFNRTTYINSRKRDPTERVPLWRSKSDAWTEEDTDKFYDALKMFGTDFFIISKMFPPRTRKQIKLKFVREERLEPDRVNAALLGRHTRRIDLDHYAQAINRDVADFHKYEGLDHANEVIRASMKDKEEAMRAAVKEDEENNRQREVQRQQREKQRVEAEKKKEERAKKKAAGRHGQVWGAGTLGGADDDDDG